MSVCIHYSSCLCVRVISYRLCFFVLRVCECCFVLCWCSWFTANSRLSFSLNCFHGKLIVSGSNGKLYLFNWLGVCDPVDGVLPVSALKMANDLLPHSTGVCKYPLKHLCYKTSYAWRQVTWPPHSVLHHTWSTSATRPPLYWDQPLNLLYYIPPCK